MTAREIEMGPTVHDFWSKSLEIVKGRGIKDALINQYWFEAGTETSSDIIRNRKMYNSIFFNQQIINDVNPVSETELFGYKLETPIMIAPMRMMETFVKNGIPKMAKAAKETGTILWMGAPMPKGLTQDYAHLGTPMIHINKCLKDRDQLLTRLLEAEDCGCLAVGVDVDSSGGLGSGYNPIDRNALPWKPLSPDELKTLRKEINIPFIVKGVLSRADAKSSMKAGADAIVISNHNGGNVDFSISPIEALIKIKDTEAGKLDIIMDSQIRRGSDVLKALALGASGVLVGATVMWAVIADESNGVVRLIDTLTDSLLRCMLYTNVESVENVPFSILHLPKDKFEKIIVFRM